MEAKAEKSERMSQAESENDNRLQTSLAQGLRPKREALPYSRPEHLSGIEKAVIELTEELSNITDLREALEHALASRNAADDNFQQSVVGYFNSLQKKFDEFSERLAHEVDYGRELEERIKNADYSRQVLLLEKELQEERAKIAIFIGEISDLVKEKMWLVEEKCSELKSADDLIKEAIMKFRTDTFSATENEYKALKVNCESLLRSFTEDAQKTLEAVKKQSMDFISHCESENKNLIRQVPGIKGKLGFESWLVLALGCVGIASLIARLFLG